MWNRNKKKKELTIEKIADYLRGKGLAVQQCFDTALLFKMDGENIYVDISEQRFNMVKSFTLDNAISEEAMLMSNNKLMSERYGLKAFIRNIPKYDESGNAIEGTLDYRELSFTIEFLCRSIDEFRDQYEWSIYALLDGINSHRQMYGEFLGSIQERDRRILAGCLTDGVSDPDEQANVDVTTPRSGQYKS